MLKCLLLLAAVGSMHAQESGFAFAAASIRPHPGPAHSMWMAHNAGGVVFTGVPVQVLLTTAFKDAYQIDGPSWLSAESFDIVAKYPPGGTFGQLDQMVLALLTDRFGMTFTREQKSVAGFALLAGENPTARLHPAVEDGGMEVSTLARLAGFLSRKIGRPVVDLTGMPGTYALKLKWPEENLDVANALRGQLGLQLKSQSVPVEVIVIHHIDRIPSEN